MTPIILASASPRRQELLKQMGIPFQSMPQNVDETFTETEPEKEAIRLAEKKVKSCSRVLRTRSSAGQWILGADTFIVSDNRYIGKPSDRNEAYTMLQNFAGRVHTVVTGLYLMLPSGTVSTASCKTEVEFSEMSPDDIEWYLETGEWQGVAGAYRIQGRGGIFIKKLTGCYYNIMGLPINTFYGMLCSNNYNFRG